MAKAKEHVDKKVQKEQKLNMRADEIQKAEDDKIELKKKKTDKKKLKDKKETTLTKYSGYNEYEDTGFNSPMFKKTGGFNA
jgi:hypothetical protein